MGSIFQVTNSCRDHLVILCLDERDAAIRFDADLLSLFTRMQLVLFFLRCEKCADEICAMGSIASEAFPSLYVDHLKGDRSFTA